MFFKKVVSRLEYWDKIKDYKKLFHDCFNNVIIAELT